MVRFYLLGIPVDSVTLQEAKNFIINSVQMGKKNYIVTINPEILMMALRDKEYFSILKSSPLNIIDGIGVQLPLKLKYKTDEVKRLPGADLFLEILKESKLKNIKIFLLGATNNVIIKCKQKIEKLQLSNNVVGFHNGYFNNDEEIINLINKSKADVLFVGMGAPKQEKWYYKNWDKLNIKIAIGVGGAFDVLAGNIKRAPALVRKIGLEWLWRTAKEPKRIKRLFFLPIYIYYVMKEIIIKKTDFTPSHGGNF